ncbi:DUF6266 family protein [Arcticibacter sp. MXS-1]|uniref:DUF6266 family protein n=1 Tax=Arcticibacter sp. MXS-1 TaxID=3341726 RepID=UPI0035A8A02B
MGIYKKGINGPFLGKTGSVIGSRWKKINYIKGFSRLSDKAPTPGQLKQRAKFEMMASLLAEIRAMLDLGYNHEDTSKKDALHLAMSYHLKWAFREENGVPVIDFSQLILSKGSLPKTAGAGMRYSAEDGLIISWPTEVRNPFISAEDQLTVLLCNERKRNWLIPVRSWKRRDGQAKLTVGNGLLKGLIHCYIFFTSWNGHNSPSQYLGTVEVDY